MSFNFVGRKRLWYPISGLILLISIVALLVRGLDFSVDFKGGAVFQFPLVVDHAQPGAERGRVRRRQRRDRAADPRPAERLADPDQVADRRRRPSRWRRRCPASSASNADDISATTVGPSWGSQISGKALEALIAFLIVIVIYLSIAFEWKMAVAAFIALMHDLVIATGIYALAGFQVSPATVIGLLTILGYSLYDTVVVFDKVRENTAGLLGGARSTYSQAANLALNQTLVRSINTSIIALLPVAAILVVGGGLLGAGELEDLALVLFVGMLSGTYSSIFIATPVLADLKEREPQYQALAKRVAVRASGGRAAKRAAAKAQVAGRRRPAARQPTCRPRSSAEDEPDDDRLRRRGRRGRRRPRDELTTTASRAPGAPASRGTPGAARPGPRQQPRRSGGRRPGTARRVRRSGASR